MKTKSLLNNQTTWILIALLLGIVVGYICHNLPGGPDQAKAIASYFAMGTEIFLRLIKTIIAPLIFATLVAGLASMGDAGEIGRIGGKALVWFVMASLISLVIGLVFANLLEPGAHINVPLPATDATTGLATSSLNLRDFLVHVFPSNIFSAMATNEILQILVFSLFFGLALGQMRDKGARPLSDAIEAAVPVMLKVTDYVMRFAPLGVFGAVANVITVEGLGVLVMYGKFAGSFFLALIVLWGVLIFAGFLVLRGEVFRLVLYVRQPMLLGFSTATSEATYPRMMEKLEEFGVSKRIIGLVLPLGYSFNLDGSMLYTTFVALFVSQAYGLPLTLEQQIVMLLVLMVSSKGIAGVPRASLVVVAAVLPMFGLPAAGVMLILGIDHFLDMGRTATNVLGNAIATAVVAKWENGIGEPHDVADETMLPEHDGDSIPATTAGASLAG